MADIIGSINGRAAAAVTQHKLVKLAASVAADGLPDAIHGTGGTDLCVGTSAQTYADNDVMEIKCVGVVIGIAGETLTLGTNHALCSGAAGVAMACTANDKQIATFLGSRKGTCTAAAGDEILMLLGPAHYEG
jgi:hypothetical protein